MVRERLNSCRIVLMRLDVLSSGSERVGVDDVEYHSLHYRQGTWKTWQNDGGRICCRRASKESIEVDAVSGVGPHVDNIKLA